MECLLHSPIHEERLAALLILVMQMAKADAKTQKPIYDLYLANTKFINNWDLVDLLGPADRRGLPCRQESQTTLSACQVVVALGSQDQHPGNLLFIRQMTLPTR